jgi:hypothetical protein
MPGTNTWFKPSTSLCLNGKNIQTVRPVQFCTEWSVKMKNGTTVNFTNKSLADAKADTKDASGDAVCSAADNRIVSVPVVSTYQGCTLWGVDNKEGQATSFFNYQGQAHDYAKNNSHAQGSSYCAQEGTLTRVMPTTYEMEFFRATASGDSYDSSLKLGSHVYKIRACTDQ